MENHLIEFRIGGVSMGFPITGVCIKFDGADCGFSVDGAGAAKKVGSRSMIPLAELLDLDFLVV